MNSDELQTRYHRSDEEILAYLAAVENGQEVLASSGDDLGGVAVADKVVGEFEEARCRSDRGRARAQGGRRRNGGTKR